jgi:hypothetical protein
MRRGNSGIIGSVSQPTQFSASGIFSLFEQNLLRQEFKWPTGTSIFRLNTSSSLVLVGVADHMLELELQAVAVVLVVIARTTHPLLRCQPQNYLVALVVGHQSRQR